MSTVAKAIMAFFTALGTWGVTAFADNGLTTVELFGLCGVIVATVGVWAQPNTPSQGEPADPNESMVGPGASLPYEDDHTTGDLGQSELNFILTVVQTIFFVLGSIWFADQLWGF